jgi:predicted flavoprotein YhiN
MRYDIEFNDSNKESFKMSIIYALNSDLLELKGKINLELLESYTNNVLRQELNNLSNFKVNIIDTNGFENAQVCSGGVSLEEINIDTMESKLVNGLFIIGELLDIDGICGGYNLTIAWISGILAGSYIGDIC